MKTKIKKQKEQQNTQCIRERATGRCKGKIAPGNRFLCNRCFKETLDCEHIYSISQPNTSRCPAAL